MSVLPDYMDHHQTTFQLDDFEVHKFASCPAHRYCLAQCTNCHQILSTHINQAEECECIRKVIESEMCRFREFCSLHKTVGWPMTRPQMDLVVKCGGCREITQAAKRKQMHVEVQESSNGKMQSHVQLNQINPNVSLNPNTLNQINPNVSLNPNALNQINPNASLNPNALNPNVSLNLNALNQINPIALNPNTLNQTNPIALNPNVPENVEIETF